MHQLGTKPVGFLVREMVGLSCTQAAFWSCPDVKRHVDGFSRWGLLAEVSVNPRPNYAYLRDLVDTTRAYESPARYLNYLTVRDKDGTCHRSRAVTLAVQMREGQQIAQFGKTAPRSTEGNRASLWAKLISVGGKYRLAKCSW
jgi:hypothetical protein